MTAPCEHLAAARPPAGRPPLECPACVAAGDRWVHLRVCLACGHVGCCDSSPNRHATGHFRATGHPVVQSIEPGESWMWCYADRAYAEGPAPAPAAQTAPPSRAPTDGAGTAGDPR